jgi:ubiquitin carboxyl-terminal hydrolase 1
MGTWEQQDAQEYLSTLLDKVETEISKATQNASKFCSLLSNVGEEADKEDNDTPSPALTNPFKGTLVHKMQCNVCGYSEGLDPEWFNWLTVPANTGLDVYNVDTDCFYEYLKPETLSGVHCLKCTLLKWQNWARLRLDDSTKLGQQMRDKLASIDKALEDEDFSEDTLLEKCRIAKKYWVTQEKTRMHAILRSPKSLAIHVNRSTNWGRKTYSQVWFPQYMDLSPYNVSRFQRSKENEEEQVEAWHMIGTNPSSEDIRYSADSSIVYALRAVIIHQGSHDSGHYVCYRRHQASGSTPYPQETVVQCAECNLPFLTTSEQLPKELKIQVEHETWWRISDADVSESSFENMRAMARNIFMLFYERVDVLPRVPQSYCLTCSPSDPQKQVSEEAATKDTVDTEMERFITDNPEFAEVLKRAFNTNPADSKSSITQAQIDSDGLDHRMLHKANAIESPSIQPNKGANIAGHYAPSQNQTPAVLWGILESANGTPALTASSSPPSVPSHGDRQSALSNEQNDVVRQTENSNTHDLAYAQTVQRRKANASLKSGSDSFRGGPSASDWMPLNILAH